MREPANRRVERLRLPDEPTEASPLLQPASSSIPFHAKHASDAESETTLSPNSTTATVAWPDEESQLQNPPPAEDAHRRLSQSALIRIILVLLIAVFVFNADHSLVLATHPRIASEFDALKWSSWLFTSFGLAGAATQAIFGKLSDIYGRKPIILMSYAGFAIGCVIVALAGSMVTVILGRVLSGSVGAGMTVIVSILITDLVPVRESATWRSYVNVAATTGRSLGGPLGGWLADAVGWRWSFGVQAPLLIIAIFLCWRNLPGDLSNQTAKAQSSAETSSSAKLTRVDFLGAVILCSFILSLLLPLELGGSKMPWTHPLIPGLFGAALLFLTLFIFVEKRWAKEPILDLSLFTNLDAVLSFLIMGLQSAAQLGMMFSVPLYFQITQRASSTVAGAHLFPAVAGNAVAGILGGILIQRTGKYKWLVYLGTLSAALSYVLLLTRWHGQTGWLESLYIFPGGFGMGIAFSVLFVAAQASVDTDQVSAAVSTLLLSQTMGTIIGVACASATMQEMLKKKLEVRLLALGLDSATRLDIISKAASNVDYAFEVTEKLSKVIVASYVEALGYAHMVSLGFVLAGSVLALFLKERSLRA